MRSHAARSLVPEDLHAVRLTCVQDLVTAPAKRSHCSRSSARCVRPGR